MSGWKIPGSFAALLIMATGLLALAALLFAAPLPGLRSIFQDSYLLHIIVFSLEQALLSALLSALLAIPIARALFRRQFAGRKLLLQLCNMTLILPILVAVFGLLTVYGRTGWLAHISQWFSIRYSFSPYGLSGILLAHLFFNLPLASRLLLFSLQQIPGQQRQLASQLGLNDWHLFYRLEWPWIKRQLLPVTTLIFMLCFASFGTVLTLGGGPKATTLELAVYQALSFDYDPGRAAILALIQLTFCSSMLLLTHRLTPDMAHQTTWIPHWQPGLQGGLARIADSLWISGLCLLLLPPVLAVITQGLSSQTLSVLRHTELWQAAGTSLGIALLAGISSLLLTLMLLWSSREYRYQGQRWQASVLEGSGMLILAMPGIVLATGWFLLLDATVGLPGTPVAILVASNALMAIPYTLKVLSHPMRDISAQYRTLCLSLDIRGLKRLRWIELTALRRPVAQALAFACVTSAGDFGIIALFGSDQFQTLPLYLYQQIGAYRSDQGAVSALLLLLLCLGLFVLIEKLAGHHAETQ